MRLKMIFPVRKTKAENRAAKKTDQSRHRNLMAKTWTLMRRVQKERTINSIH
jgi:hypothetical protein